MPEWFTHVALGLLLAELFNVNRKSIVVVGAILPDILVKLTLVRLFLPLPNIDYSILGALHVPFVFFLFTLVVAPLFRYHYGRIVLWLNLGAMSHFLSDALLRHLAGGGVRLFYPLSLNYYTASVIWPEQSYLLGLAVALAYGLLLFLKKYRWSPQRTLPFKMREVLRS